MPRLRIEKTRKPSARRPVLRLGYIVSRFPDVSEGFIRYELEEMAELAGRVDVFPLVSGPRSPDPDLAAAGIHVHPSVSGVSSLARGGAALFSRAFLRLFRCAPLAPAEVAKCFALLPRIAAIGRKASELGITHLHSHFAALPADAASIIHGLFRLPYSVTAHAYDLRVPRRMMLAKMESAGFGIAVSNWSAARAAELTAGLTHLRWHVIRNGIPIELFQSCDHARGGAGPLRLLSVGRLVEKKGFEDLLMACAILRAAGLEFSCRIIGDGPMRRALGALARRLGLEARVAFEGGLSGEPLLQAYSQSDIFALACRPAASGETDTLPVVLTEAMAAGLPVVSTRLAAIPELIEDGFNGLLAAPGDPGSFARALAQVMLDPGLRAALAQHARTFVANEYDVRKTAAARWKLMRKQVLEHGKTGDSHAAECASPAVGSGDRRRSTPDSHSGTV